MQCYCTVKEKKITWFLDIKTSKSTLSQAIESGLWGKDLFLAIQRIQNNIYSKINLYCFSRLQDVFHSPCSTCWPKRVLCNPDSQPVHWTPGQIWHSQDPYLPLILRSLWVLGRGWGRRRQQLLFIVPSQ